MAGPYVLSPARRRAGESGSEEGGAALLSPDRDVGAPAALVALGGQDLVDVTPQGPALARPRVDVVGERDRGVAPRGPLGRAHAPVLIEGLVAVDRRGVDALGPVQVVR